jgi:hypothetical protein
VTSGSLIREARLRAGLTQNELAERVGRDRAHIARWERDAVEPGLSTVRALLRACGYDLAMDLVRYDPTSRAAVGQMLRLTPSERVDRLLDRLEHEVPT